jgi:starch phosphorylase
MKAGMNGALNFSTVDGWWDEACLDADRAAVPIGFTIGTAGPYADDEIQDMLDAESLYDVLENEIIPRFYERDSGGVPRAWIASVKQSMSTLAPTWDALRMTREYTESYYLPGLSMVQRLRSGEAKSARARARDLDRLRSNWPGLTVAITQRDPTPNLREQVELVVHLSNLDPADLRVQLWIAWRGEIPRAVDAMLVDREGNQARYVGIAERRAGVEPDEVVARVLPSLMHSDGEAIASLITWSQ